MIRVLLLVMGWVALLTSCSRKPSTTEKPLFQLLDSTQTGLGFTNQLQNTDSLSILDYLYFYNGGGVAAGDLNNDGLTDLYLVSNQGPNKLYLNKGNFRFTDITAKSGTAGRAGWQTGVTLADVNGDGRLDIYVCAVSGFKGLNGTNELYINHGPGPDGTPTFTEQAADYGLAFAGFSTQAAFFDYDHDGDLDCFLLNHAVHTSRSFDNVSARTTRNRESGDYLYRNDVDRAGRPHFTDVSEQAGIFGAAMGYGLGVAVADLDNDGWEDIYVSNDFHEDDYYYVNNHKGGFHESIRQAFAHTSRFSMGNDVADVNNDGYPDVMTLDMYPADETVEKASQGEDPLDIYRYKLSYGYMNQYSRNCLQISQSVKKFIDIGVMAGVAATDWSWSPLLADYDNDGIKDLFVANGIARRPNNLDYVKYLSNGALQSESGPSVKLDEKAIQLMPEGKVHNYLYRGTASLQFDDKSEAWGFATPTLSCGAVYADLDNDGDLDLVTNNINDPAGLYRNEATTLFPDHHRLTVRLKGNGKNTFGVGAKVILKYAASPADSSVSMSSASTGQLLQVQQLMPSRGFESAVAPELLFGLGQHTVIDSVVVIWPNQRMEVWKSVKADQVITLHQTDARLDATGYHYTAPTESPLFADVTATDSIPYRHRENTDYFDFVRESLMPFKVSTEGPHLAVGDVNGDGRADIYAGGAKWQAGSLLIQQSDGRFKAVPQPAFVADSTYEDVDALFFDADGDKDLDLYVVSGGNEFYNKMPEQFDRLYLNDGKGNFRRAASALPPMYDNKSCVRPCDIDQDGDLDLFVGGRVVGFAYGKVPNSYLLINEGKDRTGEPHFSDQTDKLSDGLRKAGMITDAVWTDYDNDKDQDLILAGDWMPIRIFANDKGKFSEVKSITADETPLNGFYQRIIAADFDGDGDTDLMAGNLGTNTKFRKAPNSQLRMWVKDIDNNQTTEQIIAYNRGTDWLPIAFKDELGKQMPGIINKRFTNYVSFAGKTLNEVVKDDELKGADEFTINQFASIYLENQGSQDGTPKFVVHQLPMLAQVSKLFALQAVDIDHDGDLDVLGGGNFYGVSTYQGRYDASCGLVLRNDGKGKFTALSPVDCGFLLTGEIRDIQPVQTVKGPLLVVARNNAGLQLFKPLSLKATVSQR